MPGYMKGKQVPVSLFSEKEILHGFPAFNTWKEKAEYVCTQWLFVNNLPQLTFEDPNYTSPIMKLKYRATLKWAL
jgi:hypothetical protein